MAADYEFTSDWFSMHENTWRKVFERVSPSRILEIGSWEGRSACFIVEECAAARPIELHCVDSWGGGREYGDTPMHEVEARFDRNLERALAAAAHPVDFRKHREPSGRALAKLIANGREQAFDIIYVDGSHEAPDVLLDAILAFQLLRVEGVLIFDDYLWLRRVVEPFGMPKPAIDAFVNIYQQKVRVLAAPLTQLYVRKIAS